MLNRHVGVVIVGGGPVGMLLAAELAAYGAEVCVVETKERTTDEPRAGTLHARTVQSLARRGYLQPEPGRAGRTGRRSAPFHFAGLPGLSITAPATEPPVLVKCPQADLERRFEGLARSRGATVLRGRRAVAMAEHPDGVEVTIETAGGREQVRADYLVGADGARSTVRTAFSFPEETSRATVSALMGQVRLMDPAALEAGWRRTERGWTAAKFDARGYGRLMTLDCRGPHPDRDSLPTVEELSAEAGRITGRPVPLAEPAYLSRFNDFSRLAGTYRRGRVFLAGDSAHVHFPVGGQGLNTGLLDALNLGWKLGYVLRGTAGKDLLDTYDEERRPAGRRVVDNTRAQLALMRPDPQLDPLRAVMADLLPLPDVAGHLGGMLSAQDTRYGTTGTAHSVWRGRFLPNVALADAEDADLVGLLARGRPVLLMRPGSRPPGPARGWTHVLHPAHADGPLPDAMAETLVIRPDGYVLWTSDDGEDLEEVLRQWFGDAR
ncbi:FAD-dependent monooxygenase [Streptomyces rubradiris]|uniref:FAD-dependent oxidoreductase n=1 Tax=Streptomyces rubradiris TaxID=285531 RepID=A0ABQ3RQV8_STRRR|nr:FAD-dependent monooxygenase [Streptomyces rubradiris]GHH24740.1 FAD-dependent oxidoreductase [Streptomyces rubradiris]GHI58251.1 FAD-dependent oxidoreductase [Streptomyces rubradiris]